MSMTGRALRLLSKGGLDPTAGFSGPEIARRAKRLTIALTIGANVIGAVSVAAFGVFALPRPAGAGDRGVLLELIVGIVYLTIASLSGFAWSRRRIVTGPNGVDRWLREDATPTETQRLTVLRAPLMMMGAQAVLWGIAVVLFTAISLVYSPLEALGIGLTIAIGGVSTSAIVYLAAELSLRPVAARALAAGPVPRRRVPGLAARWLLAWALGTGAPLAGLVAIGITGLAHVRISSSALDVTVVVLGMVGLVTGAIVITLAAFATVLPIRSIRRGLERVGAGDLDASVPAWDSTEIGQLQSGFNEMVEGLRERERIRDLFGRQVGREAARQAISDEQLRLGGTSTSVAVLFVDVIGSTWLAASRDPQEVVSLLNAFFGHVVAIVEAHGGWINKFEGDAALAIFGAPEPMPGKEGAALAAARELAAALDGDIEGLAVTIGVAAGEVVAGYIGAESRFEYTVIGDPVNAAARLSELAKERAVEILATAETVNAAGPESRHWEAGDSVVLRGRRTPTQLAVLSAADDRAGREERR